MPTVTKLGPLNDKEKAEFDNIRHDDIYTCKDVKKLMRMEVYLRGEGFPTTADVIVARLRELGQRSANAEVDPELARLLAKEQARVSAEIAAWTGAQRQTDAALEAASKERFAGLYDGALPPVRAPVRVPVTETKPVAPGDSQKPVQPKADSAVGVNARSGREYYDRWEKKVEAALAEADRDDNGNAAAPAGAAAAAASTGGLKRSPELTQRLLELNRGASSAERLCLSAVEKAKGNEHFRAKEYAEAVEHYTLALGLRGSSGEASLFGNRAAAYIKLKMWDAAEQDSSAALEAEPTMLKGYIRRAAARLELVKLAEAVADCDAALALQPECKEAAELRARAVKLLQDAGMKRMAIEEVEDDEDEEGSEVPVAGSIGAVAGSSGGGADAAAPPQELGAKASAQQTGVTAHSASAPTRKKMVVVEETDSEDSGDEADKPKVAAADPAAVTSTSAINTEPQFNQSIPAVEAAAPVPPANAPAKPADAPTPALVLSPRPNTPSVSVATPATPAQATAASAMPTASSATPSQAPPRPQLVDLPPAPAPPAPTPASQFDAAVESIKLEGNKEFKSGNFVRASQLYTDALALAPDVATLYLNRSMARLSNGLNVEALRDACQAVALDPNSYKAFNKSARAKEKLRLWEGARDDMKRCLDLVPLKEERIRAEVAKELEKAEASMAAAKARAAARAAAAARAPHKVSKYGNVTIEEHADEEEESEEDKALMLPQEVVDLEAAAIRRLPRLRSQANALRAEWLQKRDAEAQEAYQRELLAWEAAMERAEAAAAAAAAAEAPAAVAATAAAITTAAAATSIEPAAHGADCGHSRASKVEAIKNEGNAHLRAQRFREAEECYQECLRLDPENLYVRLNMLVLLNETGRWAESEAAANEVLKLLSTTQASPTSEQQQNMRSKVFHRRAMALKAQGRLHEALEDLRAAKALFGQSESLDGEMETLGKLMAAERHGASPTSTIAAPSAPAVTHDPDVLAPANSTSTPQVAAGGQESSSPTQVQPAQSGVPEQRAPTVVISEPSALGTAQKNSTAPAAVAGSGVSSTTHTQVAGNTTVRRRMKVQVESDDDEEEPTVPPAKFPASTATPPTAVPSSPAAEPSPKSPSLVVSAASPEPAAVASPPAVASQPVSSHASTPSASQSAAAADVSLAPSATVAIAATTSASIGKSGSARSGAVAGDPGDPEEAARLRDEGNRLYSVGNYVRAMDFYTRSIRACAHNPAAYCNRAFVNLHLRRPADALLDAEAAIEQAGGRYPKAQLRRALALRDLGRISDAMTAVRQLLDANPNDEALLEEMQRLQRMAAVESSAPAKGVAAAQMHGNGTAKPVANGNAVAPSSAPVPTAKAPVVQAAPVRHKILVEDVSSDSEDEGAANAEANGTVLSAPNGDLAKGTQSAKARAVAANPDTAKSTSASSTSSPAAPVLSSRGPEVASVTVNTTAGQAAKVAAATASPSSLAASVAPLPVPTVDTAAAGTTTAPATSFTSNQSQLEAASAKAAAALAVAAKLPKKPKPPKNAHDLEQGLKNLAAHPHVQYEYIRSIDPATYAGVIKSNLSVKMMQAFVDAVRYALQLGPTNSGSDAADAAAAAVSPQPEDVNFALSCLESLTLVPRFEMTYGLCGKNMKEDVRTLSAALAVAGRDVSLVKKSYKL